MDSSENLSSISSSQADYEPTAYEDSSWEVVGELVETKEFVPMEVQLLPATATHLDPMFADYGGIPENPNAQRWHLPEELLVSERNRRNPDKQEDLIPKIQLTEEELAEIKASAFNEGHLSGVEEAANAGNERMSLMEQRIQEIVADLSKQSEEHRQTTEKKAAQLAISIADKLVHQTVEINPEYIIPIIKEGLGLAATAEVKQIRVSSQDLEFLNLLGIIKALKESDDKWEFLADDSIRAGCILDTSAGEIDFNLESAFERVKEKVLKVIR